MSGGRQRMAGFTLIELLVALLVLALLSLMAYRGLGVVMASRDRIQVASTQWRHAEAFFTRFERDIRLAAPRRIRGQPAGQPAWQGRPVARPAPLLEFTRFASAGAGAAPYRIGYGITAAHQIELWIWPTLDRMADTPPARFAVLDDVRQMRLQYLDAGLKWNPVWPRVPSDPPLPLAVRMEVVLGSGAVVTRVFAVQP